MRLYSAIKALLGLGKRWQSYEVVIVEIHGEKLTLPVWPTKC